MAGGCPQKYSNRRTGGGRDRSPFHRAEIKRRTGADTAASDEEAVLENKIAEYDAFLTKQDPAFTVEELEEAMQKVMDQYAGGIGTHYQFNEKQLAMAEEKIKKLQILAKGLAAADMHELMFIYELKERLTVCLTVIAHLRARKETRWHSFAENLDYPEKSDAWLCYVNSKKERGPDYDDPQRSGERRRNL